MHAWYMCVHVCVHTYMCTYTDVYVHICLSVIYKYFRCFLSHVSKCSLKQILSLGIFAQRSPFSLHVSPGLPRRVQRGECQKQVPLLEVMP